MTERRNLTPAERILALLSPLTNYERNRPDQPRWTLANSRALLQRPSATPASGLAVQVGGSKGKGTTALYFEALARHLGLRTGLYLSPHVEDVTERVQVDAQPAPMLEECVRELVEFVRRADLVDPSFFEVMTAAAHECFARVRVDLAVYEVGLGGRLDATTAIPVQLSVLTNVELEHTALLGDTVAAIAAEKAFVVRRRTPALTGATGDALAVLVARAREMQAPLRILGETLRIEVDGEPDGGFAGTIVDGDDRMPFVLPQAARFELAALAFAVSGLRRLYPDREAEVAAALRPVRFRPRLPARFEPVVRPEGTWFVDAAHTEGSLQAIAAEAARVAPGHAWPVLFASAAGKRWREGLSRLLRIVDTVYVTSLEGTVSEDPQVVCDWLAGVGVRAVRVPDPAAGIAALRVHPGPWLVTGSFYLAGQVRRLLGVGPASDRP